MKFFKNNKLYGELLGNYLYKFNQKEKNLMWSYGGVPAGQIMYMATRIRKLNYPLPKKMIKNRLDGLIKEAIKEFKGERK